MKISTLWYSILILVAIMIAVDLTRPLLPIDETRYLTVAWEYHLRKAWILPTLNFEPYSHKPPMLFWLINIFWQMAGHTDVWPARLVTLIGSIGTIFLTLKIGRTLWPQAPEKGDIAALMLLATPFFLIYSSIIMFDTLLSVAVLLGIYAMLKAYLTAERRYMILLGLAFGLGALIKGPVILLHLLPVLLLSAVWQREFKTSKTFWFGGTFIAVAIGLAIALTWALPAAHIGGPDYKEMIFWGQSAGRMVHSFDHAHPFWFYLALLPAITLPWILVPSFWFGGRTPNDTGTWQSKFLLCWMIPVFIAFMAISGKQAHYLIPLLPALFLLMAHYLVSRGLFQRVNPLSLFLWSALPGLLILGTLTMAKRVNEFATIAPNGKLGLFMEQINVTTPHSIQMAIALILVLALILAGLRRTIKPSTVLKAVSLTYAITIICIHGSAQPLFAKYYDLAPAGAALAAAMNDRTSIAITRPWQGELGYLARLDRRVDSIKDKDIHNWLTAHPGGIVICRHGPDALAPEYRVFYHQPYRSGRKNLSLIQEK